MHVIGTSAAELIHIAQSVMSLDGTLDYLRDAVFNHPSWSEAYKIAALNGFNRLREAIMFAPVIRRGRSRAPLQIEGFPVAGQGFSLARRAPPCKSGAPTRLSQDEGPDRSRLRVNPPTAPTGSAVMGVHDAESTLCQPRRQPPHLSHGCRRSDGRTIGAPDRAWWLFAARRHRTSRCQAISVGCSTCRRSPSQG